MLGSTPILSEKTIAVANDLGIKVGSEFRPVICQTSDPEITAESRSSEINVLLGVSSDKNVETRSNAPQCRR